jgi:hypothetical protein
MMKSAVHQTAVFTAKRRNDTMPRTGPGKDLIILVHLSGGAGAFERLDGALQRTGVRS